MKILATLLFFLCSTVHAELTVFSFVGLQWGDDIATAGARLKAAKLQYASFIDPMTCIIKDECYLDFESEVNGSLHFASGKLDSVTIFSSDLYTERAEKLRAKYGQPTTRGIRPGDRRSMETDTVLHLYWESANGESLEMFPSGYILYRSARLQQESKKRKLVQF